ncbi:MULTISPECIES: hypothetical protein [unclassified Neisseria]|uniref:hypothetical protein n=1 Tax=unclassified Neisseria TaxID=2623750 RepID=UPI0010717663|nr:MULTISPECIES: hypothetical protein [unclassified Neisseria]MBF0804134.1 hypothetical protein [Neisseria sp. 19428wB4_WF04]TFU43150.1 hypothetical protein E4T99_07150 [Neisseria sp. WF04]
MANLNQVPDIRAESNSAVLRRTQPAAFPVVHDWQKQRQGRPAVSDGLKLGKTRPGRLKLSQNTQALSSCGFRNRRGRNGIAPFAHICYNNPVLNAVKPLARVPQRHHLYPTHFNKRPSET